MEKPWLPAPTGDSLVFRRPPAQVDRCRLMSGLLIGTPLATFLASPSGAFATLVALVSITIATVLGTLRRPLNLLAFGVMVAVVASVFGGFWSSLPTQVALMTALVAGVWWLIVVGLPWAICNAQKVSSA